MKSARKTDLCNVYTAMQKSNYLSAFNLLSLINFFSKEQQNLFCNVGVMSCELWKRSLPQQSPSEPWCAFSLAPPCKQNWIQNVQLLSHSGVSILMSYGENPHYVKLPIFSEFMENSTKIYEKLSSDQMDPKSALGGPKPISRTGLPTLLTLLPPLTQLTLSK